MGKVFIESYVIKFEDEDRHHITLKTSDDLKIAVRQYEKNELMCVTCAYLYNLPWGTYTLNFKTFL